MRRRGRSRNLLMLTESPVTFLSSCKLPLLHLGALRSAEVEAGGRRHGAPFILRPETSRRSKCGEGETRLFPEIGLSYRLHVPDGSVPKWGFVEIRISWEDAGRRSRKI